MADDGLTFEQLQAMGAKPSGDGLTFEQLQAMGAKPSAPASPQASPTQQQMSTSERVGQGMAGVNSAVDRMFFGIPSMLLRGAAMIDHATGMEEPGFAEKAAHGIEDYRSNNPRLSAATDLPGYVEGGPAALAKGVERLLPKVANPVAKVGRAAVAGAGTNAALSEAESAFNGSDLSTAGKNAGAAAEGGAALGTLSGLLGAGANAVLGGKGAKAREFIESRGGKVGVTSPGKGGPMDTMDVKGNDAAAQGEQSRIAGERVDKGMADYKQQVASDPYAAEVAKIGPKAASARVVEMDQILDHLRTAARTEQDPIIRHQLEDQIDTIERTATVDVGKQSLPYRDAPQAGKPIYSETELNDLRQVMGDKGKVGQSNKASLAPLREATSKVKAEVDQGPFAPANKAFSTGMKDYEESINLLDMKKNKKAGPNEANINKVRIKAQRKGNNDVTPGSERQRIDKFSAKHPELGLELDRPELLKKQADLEFTAGGMPGHGFFERASHISAPLALALAASGGNLKTAAAIATFLLARNSAPIAGRLLHDPALMAKAASELPKSLLFQAARGGNE